MLDPVLLFQVFIPVFVFLLAGGAGRVQERRHERSLARRELALAHVVLVDVAEPPGPASGGALVVGHVVLGCDYGKQLLARVRDIFGGEIRSFRRVLDRARREAVLRMQQQADALGSGLVVNVRFTTAMMGSGLLAAEVICYGTAVVR